MCGIAGILYYDGRPAELEIIRRMTDAMVHRGPDGEGYHCDGSAALGHRRLAIIDLSEHGKQPLFSADGRYSITYNGELYNYRELRADLEKAGYRFLSQSDTEVVLAAYIVWGADGLIRFNGHFAFAIWDSRKREFFLARDRFGVKPLVYYCKDGLFAFASEQKALLQHPRVRCLLDRRALLEYFTFQNLFTSRTFFQDIQTFPAGHYAIVRPDGSAPLTLREYWDYNFCDPEQHGDETEYRQELERLFEQAVKRQLVSDVEVGSYLSGGIDSGSITAVAAKIIPDIKTFTCGFDKSSTMGMEASFDERENAEYMSYAFRTEHYEMVLKAGDMERCIEKVVWHLETPKVGQSYPNFFVSKLAGRFVKVVLGGTGGDELFGGYPWRYYRAVVNADFNDYVGKYYQHWQRLIPNSVIQKAFVPIWGDVKDVWTQDIFRDVFKKHKHRLGGPEDYVNHSLYFEVKTFLQGLLEVEDKLHMAHSLELRLPFLDNDLVDFAMRVPVKYKLGNLQAVVHLNENDTGDKLLHYLKKTKDGKMLLRAAMERFVPSRIAQGEKKGFSAPDESWFKGDSVSFVRRLLCDDNSRIYEYLDYPTINALVEEHLQGRINRRLLIWSLLNFEYWLKLFGQHLA